MRLRYFTYYFENKSAKKNSRMPVFGILDAYCEYPCSLFKNAFKHNDETVFLLRERINHYVFVKTKDTELVKAINKADIKVDEITQRLLKDESVGFASHIYVADNFLGFASTHLAPTVSAFSTFLNQLLLKLGVGSYKFVISPLTTQITRRDAKKMKFVGKTSLKINRSNSKFEDFVSVLGIGSNEMDDLQSFEVIINPVPKRNIKKAANQVFNIPPTGIERFQIRAREELHDRLTDFRIEDSLVIHDFVQPQANEDVFTAIERIVGGNSYINSKVAEHDKENKVKEHTISDLSKFHSIRNWPSPSGNT